jgi:2',5'-phosphodiesterase
LGQGEAGGNKRKAKKLPDDETVAELSMSFLDSAGLSLDTKHTLHDVLLQAKHLVLNDVSYAVAMNPPQPVQVNLYPPFVAGCPVIHKVDVDNGSTGDLQLAYTIGEKVVLTEHYFPSAEDVGKTIQLTVSNPELTEFEISSQSSDHILPYPSVDFRCRFSSRLDDSPGGQFRACTFNILAQGYAATNYAAKVMYSHVKDEAHLSFGYRNSLIFRELLNFNGDLLLLQEVAPQVVERCIYPLFGKTHNILYVGKENSQRPNGVSIISARRKFKQLLSQDVQLGGDSLFSHFTPSEQSDISAAFGPIFIDGVLPNLTTVASVAVLESVDGPVFIVANTHLFYHNHGPHCRLLQIIALVRIIEGLKVRYPQAQVVIGGDLNSRPDTAVMRYLSTGQVTREDRDWQFGNVFSWGRDGDEGDEATPAAVVAPNPTCTGIFASHSLKLNLAWKNQPQLTHATACFGGVLDYLLISSDGLSLVDDFAEKQLTSEVVEEFGGLPCEAYGSDHVMVAAQLAIL